MTEPVTMRAFHADDRTRDWRVVGDGAIAVFRTGSFAAGARLVQAIAAAAGDTGPHLIQTVQVTIDALVSADVMPFWAAVLGYERRAGSPDEDLVDPRWRGPSIWFQNMDASRPQRNRFHIDVWVPPELAGARVAAALAAGGRMVRDASPTWWTLADAEGNEVDVTSATGRD